MKRAECELCEGRGYILDWPEYPCDRCDGAGDHPAEWNPPEEPPPHTDADAPPWETLVYCDGCWKLTTRCECTDDDVNENELRAYLDRVL